MRSILLLPHVARCKETIDYVCCSDCVGLCWNVCCVVAVVKDIVLTLGVSRYVVCLCKGCDGCFVFCFYCEACIGARVLEV